MENEGILTLKGITTLWLWKSHCFNRWQHIYGSSRVWTDSQAWRSLYFQQHFIELINKLSRSNDHQNILKESCQSLFSGLRKLGQLHLCSTLTEKRRRLEHVHTMMDLCAKHLQQVRLYNAMCLYLDGHRDILIKLAESIVHLKVFGLKDNGIISLSNMIPLMIGNQLTALTLDGCFLYNEAKLVLLLHVLAFGKIHSSPVDGDDCCQTRHAETTETLCDSVKHRTSDLSTEMVQTEEDISRSGNSTLQTAHIIDTEISEDDLYDDIFSQNPKKLKLDVPSSTDKNFIRSNTWLTLLELNECRFSVKAMKVLAETLVHFRDLHTLILRETCSLFYAEMNELINSIGVLVATGSLCCLEVKFCLITDQQGMMFCDMIMCYCEKCSSHSSKGLRSLKLDGDLGCDFGMLTGDFMSKKLTTCSYCGGDDIVSEGIRELYLKNFVNGSRMNFIFKSINRNRSLHSLSLPSCCCKTEEIAELFNCISGCGRHTSNNSITKLDLRENSFIPLADGSLSNLIKHSQLTYLDLSYCSIEVIPDDVILALCSNNILRVLKIAGNRLGDNGAAAITEVFKTKEKKSVLTSIDLSCNRMTSSSLLHLGEVLKTWPRKLTDITIIGNLLNDSQEEVKICLEEVFDIVITKWFDDSMAFVDYVSVM